MMELIIGRIGVWLFLACWLNYANGGGLIAPSIITAHFSNDIYTENSTETSPNPTKQIFPVSVSVPVNKKDCILTEGNLDDLDQNQFFNLLTKECRYDKLLKPDSTSPGKPLIVKIHLHVKHLQLLDQEQFKTDTLIQYRYVDPRLNFERLAPKRPSLLGRDAMRNRIWTPRLVVPDEKEAKVVGDPLVSISAKGEVSYTYRTVILNYCHMDFRKFPFDRQTCRLNFQSWLHNASKISLRWEDRKPIEFSQEMVVAGFTLEKFWTSSSTVYLPIATGIFRGNYSTLEFRFRASRQIGHYLRDYFIPSVMLVAMSWVTFWLRADASPPRTTVGTATLLAFITLAALQTKPLPKVSYIKASEIWFLTCSIFILASLFEFAFVNLIFRRRKQCELKKVNSKYIFKCTLTPSLARNELYKLMGSFTGDGKNESIKGVNFDEPVEFITNGMDIGDGAEEGNPNKPWTTMSPPDVANWIDTRCRILFPLAFLFYNILFWTYAVGFSPD